MFLTQPVPGFRLDRKTTRDKQHRRKVLAERSGLSQLQQHVTSAASLSIGIRCETTSRKKWEDSMKKLGYVIATVALTVLLIEPVSADKSFSVRDVKGRYVFSFQGEMPGVAVFAATGVIVADGKGSITAGVRMITVNGVPSTGTFTCSITVHLNGTGSAVCPPDNPTPGFPAVETYGFVLSENGRTFRFVSTVEGLVILGSGERQ
jgi:hypothetical protein